MKKITLFFLIQLIVTCVFAQQTIYLNQGFSTVPPTGWTIDAQSANWLASATANAGGTAPECDFNYNPEFTGISRLISPQINTTGATSIILNFKYMLDDYAGGYTIGVATSSNGTTWTDAWTIVNPTGGIPASDTIIQISNADVGSSSFQICFYFNGDAYNINDWFIDDVSLFKSYNVDAKMAACTVPSYIQQGNINVTGNVVNYGLGNITSLILNYKINNGTVNTTNITGINIATTQNYNFTLTPTWAATPGNYSLKLWISDVNGNGKDSCNSNDTIVKPISIATQTATRMPLYEEFSSSTCNPCASFNSSTFTPFITANPNAFSLVKYQMNWPGAGDSYYTAEGGTRRAYYGVNGVPDLFIDGANSTMTSTGMTSELSDEATKPTFFVISQTPTYIDSTVTATFTITPYITGTFKVYAAVVEKTTTGNVSTNGETSFIHVMMKMLPDGNGTTVNFAAGTNYTHTFVQDMSSTHVEHMSDLQVVIFVQENTSKEVFQSSFSDIVTGINENDFFNSFNVYPNPFSGNTNVEIALNQPEKINMTICNLLGEKVYSTEERMYNAGINNIVIDANNLRQGVYYLNAFIGGKTYTKKLVIVK